MLNSYAPILITTLNRFEHFKRCVESLLGCTHVTQTDLYIALDYPAKDCHWDGYLKIQKYLENLSGFNSITIIKRKINLGALKNSLDSHEIILNKYDKLIFTEDDNEFSPNFLDYINKGLEEFKDNKNITAICGYNYPIVVPLTYNHNYYYFRDFSAWGYGIWKDRYKEFYYTPEEQAEFLSNWRYAFQAYKICGLKIRSHLNTIKLNLPLYGDGVISLENIKNDRYCIFPTVSKVRNSGHDGSGVHCGYAENDIFSTQEIDNDNDYKLSKNVPIKDTEVSKTLRKYFSITYPQKIKTLALYLTFLLNVGLNKK